VAFLDILLDDCYGLGMIGGRVATVLDIGAHVGLFGIAARNAFPRAVIHAYEPNPLVEPYLKAQAQAADFQYFMCAAGLEDGTFSLDVHEDSVRTRSRSDPAGSVPQVPFQEMLARLGGEADLLKLDCEGAEWLLFEDRPTWQHVRNLSMEYHLWPDHTHAEVR